MPGAYFFFFFFVVFPRAGYFSILIALQGPQFARHRVSVTAPKKESRIPDDTCGPRSQPPQSQDTTPVKDESMDGWSSRMKSYVLTPRLPRTKSRAMEDWHLHLWLRLLIHYNVFQNMPKLTEKLCNTPSWVIRVLCLTNDRALTLQYHYENLCRQS